MAIKLVSSREAAALHGVKILLYGKAGYGKTWLARTAPNPIVLSAESGVLSLRDVDIPTVGIGSIKDLEDSYKWLKESKEAADFHTVYMDSSSEVAEVILSQAKALSKDPRAAYGELIEKMTVLLKAFRDLPGKHVVMTAKQAVLTDSMTGVNSYGPSMPGSRLGNEIPYLFDEVFRLGIGKTPEGGEYRFIQTRPDLQYEAKDRSGVLDPYEPPHIGSIITKILSSTQTGV